MKLLSAEIVWQMEMLDFSSVSYEKYLDILESHPREYFCADEHLSDDDFCLGEPTSKYLDVQLIRHPVSTSTLPFNIVQALYLFYLH